MLGEIGGEGGEEGIGKQPVNGVYREGPALVHAVIEHIARARIGNLDVLPLAGQDLVMRARRLARGRASLVLAP